MRLIRRGGAILVVAACLAMACNALTGVGDLEATDDSGVADGAKTDGSSLTNPKTDGSVDSIVDAGPPPRCPSAGHGCTKSPPPGWDGPFLLYGGDADAQVPPACPTELPATVDGPTGDPAGAFTCECKCGGVTGAKCTAFLDEFDGGGCVDPQAGREDLSSCLSRGVEVSYRASLDVTDKGSCASSASFKSKEPPSSAMLRVCRRPGPFVSDGCAADELCVPNAIVHSCIGNSDVNATCPAPWTEPHRIFDSIADTRACDIGSCGCEDPTGTTCSARMKHFTFSTGCQGPGPSYDIPLATCIPAGAGSSQKLSEGPTAAGGSCNPKGEPAANGGLAGAGGRMICCVP